MFVYLPLLLLGYLLLPYKVAADPPNLSLQPKGVAQNLPYHCSSLSGCIAPAFHSRPEWQKHQKTCCGHELKYHCIKQYDEQGLTHPVIACVHPVTCDAGTYAFIELGTSIVTGQRFASVSCLSCPSGHFQPRRKESFRFRYSRCHKRQQCHKEEGMVLAKEGNSTNDNLCRCWWEGSYVPDEENTRQERFSPKGFTGKPGCLCVHKQCPTGEAVGEDYKCAPATTHTTTSKPAVPTTQGSAGTTPKREGSSSTANRLQTAGFAVIILMCTAFIV